MKVDPRPISFGVLALLLEIMFFVLYITLCGYGENGLPSWMTYPNHTYTRPHNKTENITFIDRFLLEEGSIEVDPFIFFPPNTTIPPVGDTTTGPYYSILPINVMIFAGLGLMFSAMKCTSFSGLGLVFFLAAFVFQWAALVVPWLLQAAVGVPNPEHIKYNITMIIEILYAVFSLIVAYGALVGRTSRIQLLIIGLFGVVLYAVNRMVVVYYLLTLDNAGSMTVFTFGAYFGLAISWGLNVFHKSCKDTKAECARFTGYFENFFALLGTLILFTHWPYFNAYLIPVSLEMYVRAIVNTYFALVAGVVVTYALSSLISKCYKIDIIHIQRSTIAAGVAVASVAPCNLRIWGAVLLGASAAMFSIFQLRVVQRFLPFFYLVDSTAIFSSFAIPGIVGGIASAVMAALCLSLGYTQQELLIMYPAVVGNQGVGSIRDPIVQGGYQFASLMVSIGIAIVGGVLVGIIVRYMGPLNDDEICNDSCTFVLPYGCGIPCETTKCVNQYQNTNQT